MKQRIFRSLLAAAIAGLIVVAGAAPLTQPGSGPAVSSFSIGQ